MDLSRTPSWLCEPGSDLTSLSLWPLPIVRVQIPKGAVGRDNQNHMEATPTSLSQYLSSLVQDGFQ